LAARNLQKPAETETDLSAGELNQIVNQISRLVMVAGLEAALRVGALIIHHFHGGSTDSWRERGPKTTSFRRLSEHPALPMSAGALYRCVAIFELCDRLRAPSRWRNLGTSHFRVVLGVDETSQERLLATANAERWSVRTLQIEVVKGRLARQSKGGRRPQSPVTKIAKTIRKCLDEQREAADRLEELDLDELEGAMLVLDETREWLVSVRESLQNKRPDEA
jgi:hypothetical protein